MSIKPIALLLIPLIVILLVFGLLNIQKDPVWIMNNARSRFGLQDEFITESNVVTDFALMDSVMRYVSNVTTAVSNGRIYTRVVTQTPFAEQTFTEEQFILEQGNFSCTNSLVRPVCFRLEPADTFSELLEEDDYKSIEYLGTKSINQVACDAIRADVNTTLLNEVAGGEVEANISKVNDIFLYSCIDPETGVSMESIWGIQGETNLGSFIMDIGINITKKVNSFSDKVPESLFNLPYEVVSQEDYELLVNQTQALINQTTLQTP